MAFRWTVMAALITFSAIPGNLPSQQTTHQRQTIDEALPESRQANEAPAAHIEPVQVVTHAPTDVPTTTAFVDVAQVLGLQTDDTFQMPLPSGRDLNLTLKSRRPMAGGEVLTLSDGALTSTLSVRGNQMVMTVAAPEGAYRVSGNHLQQQMVAHTELAHRQILREKDYRYVQP